MNHDYRSWANPTGNSGDKCPEINYPFFLLKGSAPKKKVENKNQFGYPKDTLTSSKTKK